MTEIKLSVSGASPLGFLCAIGLLKVLTSAKPEWNPKLHWSKRKAILRIDEDMGEERGREAVVSVTSSWLSTNGFGRWIVSKEPMPVLNRPYDKNDKDLSDEARKEAVNAMLKDVESSRRGQLPEPYQMSPGYFEGSNWVPGEARRLLSADSEEASYAACLFTDADRGGPSWGMGMFCDTSLLVMLNGGRNRHFLADARKNTGTGAVRHFVSVVREEHYRDSLFGSWIGPRQSEHTLYMDDVEARMSEENSGRSRWGANRLALEAMPLFPCVRREYGPSTAGFVRDGDEESFQWPLWGKPCSLESAMVLVLHRSVSCRRPWREDAIMMGVTDIFKSTRMTKKQGVFVSYYWLGQAAPLLA